MPSSVTSAWQAAALAHLGHHDEAAAEAAWFLATIRQNWFGAEPATDEMIVRWLLHLYPISRRVEWVRLRHADGDAGFDRHAAFIRANPDWPGMLLRRRAEQRLWQERRDAATVRRFIGDKPASANSTRPISGIVTRVLDIGSSTSARPATSTVAPLSI